MFILIESGVRARFSYCACSQSSFRKNRKFSVPLSVTVNGGVTWCFYNVLYDKVLSKAG